MARKYSREARRLPAINWRSLSSIAAWIGLAITTAWVYSFDYQGDAHAYWSASQTNPYWDVVDASNAYLYSPAFLQLLAPFQALPWDVFRGLWLAGAVALLAWMTGPVMAVVLLVPGVYSPVWTDVYFGNVYIYMTAALVVGMRYPAAMAFLFLTKLTPGIAAAWFAVRQEWRKLAVALGATAAMAIASFLWSPELWAQWADVLMRSRGVDAVQGAKIPPLEARLIAAALLLGVGAWRGWRWVLPLAVLLAQPVLWYSAFTLLVAWFALLRSSKASANQPAAFASAAV